MPDREQPETGALSVPNPDSGAIAFLRSRGYSDQRIEALVHERTGLMPRGQTRIIKPIERAAVRLLAGYSTPETLWKLACQRIEHEDSARRSREELYTELRARVVRLAEFHHDVEPSLTRSEVIGRIRNGAIPSLGLLQEETRRDPPEDKDGNALPFNTIRFNEVLNSLRHEAGAIKKLVKKLTTRTLENWIGEDCPEIPAPKGRPTRRKRGIVT